MDTHNAITLGSAALWLHDVDTGRGGPCTSRCWAWTRALLERVDAPGVPVTEFTLKDLEDGRLRFVADSSGKSPWMDVSVEGGSSQRMRFLLQTDGSNPTPPTDTDPTRPQPSGPIDPGHRPCTPLAPPSPGPDPQGPATVPAANVPPSASVDGEGLWSVRMEPHRRWHHDDGPPRASRPPEVPGDAKHCRPQCLGRPDPRGRGRPGGPAGPAGSGPAAPGPHLHPARATARARTPTTAHP